jgi:hypothetical protein
MRELNKVKISAFQAKVKKLTATLLKTLVKRAFWTALALLFLGLVLPLLVFYQYIILAKTEPLGPGKSFQFNEKGYLQVLEHYQKLQEKDNLLLNYPDPFRKSY